MSKIVKGVMATAAGLGMMVTTDASKAADLGGSDKPATRQSVPPTMEPQMPEGGSLKDGPVPTTDDARPALMTFTLGGFGGVARKSVEGVKGVTTDGLGASYGVRGTAMVNVHPSVRIGAYGDLTVWDNMGIKQAGFGPLNVDGRTASIGPAMEIDLTKRLSIMGTTGWTVGNTDVTTQAGNKYDYKLKDGHYILGQARLGLTDNIDLTLDVKGTDFTAVEKGTGAKNDANVLESRIGFGFRF